MKRVVATLVVAMLVACTAGEGPPSTGTYQIRFPSTAAAVATDAVQLLVFDVAPKDDAATLCQSLLVARKRGDDLKPVFTNSPVNICEMLHGTKSVTLSYGEKAVMAVALRRTNNSFVDFLIGCTVQTVGDGSFLLDVPVSLVDVGQSVPDPGDCNGVGEYCSGACKPN